MLGTELHARPKYFNASVHHAIHFGVMLLQVVWRKTSEETEAADEAIGDLRYELIARGQYALAIRILQFARDLRNVSSDLRRRRNIVNLANAYKLSKDDASAIKVLSSEDWSATGDQFKISVAAVKGDASR